MPAEEGNGRGLLVHELVQNQARRAPRAIAVVDRDATLTYGELNNRANRLAWWLRARGVGPDILVGVHLERSLDMVVTLLAILKAGGTYVPLDPVYPPARLAHMVEDTGAHLVLTRSDVRGRLSARASVVCLDAIENDLLHESPEDPDTLVDGDHLAYVLYTSGTTGFPKGVMIRHRALAHYVEAATLAFDLRPTDRVLQFASISFDTAAEEIYPCLARGARLVLRTNAMLRSITAFFETCEAWQISVLDLPTAYWHDIVTALEAGGSPVPTSLRLVIIGGEEALPERVAQWHERVSTAVRLVNTYGPTEATIVATSCDLVTPISSGPVPIGRAMGGAEVWVLDDTLQPASPGVRGEICIGGVGLARGYLGHPDLTAESFVPHPASAYPGARLYRTGDLGRYRADGLIEFLGRRDDQLKIRGYRVEPGEVAAALRRHPAVRDAVVIAQVDSTGRRSLTAYAVPRTGETLVPTDLRAFLGTTLPEYMVPRDYVFLDVLPRTLTGKLDRRALPLPAAPASASAPFLNPRTTMEQALAAVWGTVLGLERIDARDNFFDLGGDSLLAIRMIAHVGDALGIEVPLRWAFETPVLAALAERLEVSRRDVGTLGHAPVAVGPRRPFPVPSNSDTRSHSAPASVAQEGIWLDEQLRPGTPMYNIPEAFRLRGRLDLAALQHSIAAIVRRHDALRTTVAWIDGRLAQEVAPPAPFILPVVNLDDLSEIERTEAILRLSAKEARRPFDLAHGPLFRASLLRLADDDHVLLMTMHHLVSDAWSCAVVAKELETLYGAGGRDEVLSVDRPRIQFADVARWQRGRLESGELNAQRAYWETQLRAGAEGLELIADYRHPHLPSARGGLHSTKLPSHLVKDLHAMCRREGITRFMALLASLALLLSRYARQDDIPVLVPVANRGRPELEDVVGCCFNMLVLRTDLSGNPRVRELLSRVRGVALGAYANQELPVVDLVAPGMGRRQWFRVLPAVFIFQNVPQSIPALSGLEVHRIDTDTAAAGTDICLDLIESPDGLTAKWKYNCDLFEDTTIARMATHFEVLLAQMVIDPDRRIHDLPLLTEMERDTLCRAWNGPERSVPEVGTVHGLFARQVETTPDAIAVIDGTERLSYRDLNRRSNQLAHHLRALGVGPGTRVGLYIRRSAAMVVGLVGILKTGASYVPLGMSDPESRVHRVLEDAQISVLVSEDILGRGRVSFNGPIVRLDSDRNILERTNAGDLASDVGPDDTAYIAYTSGSTGNPKGVVALHRGIVNRLAWIWDVFPFKKHEVCCQRTPLAFVDCVAEIFGPLLKGIPLVVLPDVLVQDPAWLTARLAEYRVTRIVLVPSLLRMLLEHRPDLATRLPDLALWFTSGEPLDTELAERFHDRMRGRRLINLYGCSEASADSTYFEVAGSSGRARVPVGRPIWNTQTYVLDDALHPVPVGLPGELYVGGTGLARGYWRDPRLTAERFIPDAFGRQPGARLYRTGDLARYGPGGNLEYLGRVDQQLKVRGIRIEPGEIETALTGHPAISRVAVAAHDNAPGDRRLIAYYVPRPSATVTPGDLREFLASRLPDAMVPSWFVSVPSLPLTASGKLDRLRLPAPDPEALAARAVLVTPRTDTEVIVGEVWREVLGLAQISVDDSFFELGGTSLLAARLVGRLASRVRRQIPVRAVFENETVAKLARYLDSGRTPFTERFRWADDREQFDL